MTARRRTAPTRVRVCNYRPSRVGFRRRSLPRPVGTNQVAAAAACDGSTQITGRCDSRCTGRPASRPAWCGWTARSCGTPALQHTRCPRLPRWALYGGSSAIPRHVAVRAALEHSRASRRQHHRPPCQQPEVLHCCASRSAAVGVLGPHRRRRPPKSVHLRVTICMPPVAHLGRCVNPATPGPWNAYATSAAFNAPPRISVAPSRWPSSAAGQGLLGGLDCTGSGG